MHYLVVIHTLVVFQFTSKGVDRWTFTKCLWYAGTYLFHSGNFDFKHEQHSEQDGYARHDSKTYAPDDVAFLDRIHDRCMSDDSVFSKPIKFTCLLTPLGFICQFIENNPKQHVEPIGEKVRECGSKLWSET